MIYLPKDCSIHAMKCCHNVPYNILPVSELDGVFQYRVCVSAFAFFSLLLSCLSL